MFSKAHLIYLLFFLLTLPFEVNAESLNVAVAANVQIAFNEIQDAFLKETGHQIKPTYGSSGKLAAQILNGAPFDIFLSADMAYPKKLHEAGYAIAAPKIYAHGTLVLWSAKDIDLMHWQSTLSKPTVRHIAIANPKTAPYGTEALKVLQYYKLDRVLMPKLVYGDSISQTNQFIYSMTVDVGFTAKSVVMSMQMKDVGKWIEIPQEAYTPIAQGAVILKHGHTNHEKVAQLLYSFLYSEKARSILKNKGYL